MMEDVPGPYAAEFWNDLLWCEALAGLRVSPGLGLMVLGLGTV